jgi:two-component system phosphate regulon response regulator PhoB
VADVLVVEDTADLRDLLEVRLQKEGHRVLSASSGEEALTLLAGRKASDVIVLDVVMPGMSGLELHAALRRDPALAQVPVIFLSGCVQPGDIEGRPRARRHLPDQAGGDLGPVRRHPEGAAGRTDRGRHLVTVR